MTPHDVEIHYESPATNELNEAGREFGRQEYQAGWHDGFSVGFVVGIIVTAIISCVAFTFASMVTEIGAIWP